MTDSFPLDEKPSRQRTGTPKSAGGRGRTPASGTPAPGSTSGGAASRPPHAKGLTAGEVNGDDASADLLNDAALAPNAPAVPGTRRKPAAVVRRLSLYSRVLYQLEKSGVEKVSSRDLAERLGINSAQVRKDLAHFGQFGVPGYGYNVSELRTTLRGILGMDRAVRVALVGVGNLGLALLSYGGFRRQGLEIVAAFDADKRKVGGKRGEVPIYDVAELGKRLVELGVDIIILAVPETAAQLVAQSAVEAGVSAILNFVPCRLNLPDSVVVQDVDLSLEIEALSFYLKA